jgi:DNA-binding transcriptional ArsR family regulator
MSLPNHEIGPNFADLAALIGDPVRAAILWSLMGGECRPAGELARIAGLSPQAASTHLTRLVDGGLLRVEPKGRHRFFRLSGPEAASAIENLAAAATVLRKDARIVSLVPKPLREARRCWAHLAGECGVHLHDAFIARGWVIATNSGYALADAGRLAVVDLGVHLSALKAGRRGFLFDCLDWSERRPHFAGPLASALLTVMIDAGWFTEVPGSRQLMITPTGHQKLRKLCEDERGEPMGLSHSARR